MSSPLKTFILGAIMFVCSVSGQQICIKEECSAQVAACNL